MKYTVDFYLPSADGRAFWKRETYSKYGSYSFATSYWEGKYGAGFFEVR